MPEVYPVVIPTGRSAQYAVHARVGYTAGETTTIAQASSYVDLGAERTVEIVGGFVSGNVCISSSMSIYSSAGCGAGAQGAASYAGSGYVELRRADNSTVVGRLALPITNPIRFSNVRYVYIFVEVAVACDIAPDSYYSSGARSAAVVNGTVYFNIV